MNFKKPEFSLGWELEACQGAVIAPEGIEVGYDGSVNGEKLEYKVELPYVTNIEASMAVLGNLMRLKRLKIDSSCGFHIHIGLKNYPKSFPGFQGLWASWCVVLAKEVENAVFDCVPESRKVNRNCKKWLGIYIPQGVVKQPYRSSKYDNQHRYHWVNITEMFRPGGLKTVEIRLMGDTNDYLVLLSWMATFLSFARHAYTLVYDPSRLDHVASLVRHDMMSFKDLLNTPKNHLREKENWTKQIFANHRITHGLTTPSVEKLIALGKVDNKAPVPNDKIQEEGYRYRHHGNVSYNDYRRQVGLVANKGVKGCECNSCNYFFYVNKKGNKKKEAQLNVGPRGIIIDDGGPHGEYGFIENVRFVETLPPHALVTPPSNLTSEQIRRAVEELRPTNVPPEQDPHRANMSIQQLREEALRAQSVTDRGRRLAIQRPAIEPSQDQSDIERIQRTVSEYQVAEFEDDRGDQ